MFSQVFLCPQRGGFLAHITGHMTGGSASKGVCIQEGSASRGDQHLGGWADPLPKIHGMLQDTVNNWAVHILLKCFLIQVHPEGVCLWGGGCSASGGLGKPPQDTWDATGYGQQLGGTHPTGMLSYSGGILKSYFVPESRKY